MNVYILYIYNDIINYKHKYMEKLDFSIVFSVWRQAQNIVGFVLTQQNYQTEQIGFYFGLVLNPNWFSLNMKVTRLLYVMKWFGSALQKKLQNLLDWCRPLIGIVLKTKQKLSGPPAVYAMVNLNSIDILAISMVLDSLKIR